MAFRLAPARDAASRRAESQPVSRCDGVSTARMITRIGHAPHRRSQSAAAMAFRRGRLGLRGTPQACRSQSAAAMAFRQRSDGSLRQLEGPVAASQPLRWRFDARAATTGRRRAPSRSQSAAAMAFRLFNRWSSYASCNRRSQSAAAMAFRHQHDRQADPRGGSSQPVSRCDGVSTGGGCDGPVPRCRGSQPVSRCDGVSTP